MYRNQHVICIVLFITSILSFAENDSLRSTPSNKQLMSLDVKDTDIQDVVRMISKGYELNIIVDPKVKGPVTVHLTNVPIMEGLESIAHSRGLEVIAKEGIYLLREKIENNYCKVSYKNGYVTIDALNAGVGELLTQISEKSGVNIVIESGSAGEITGKLYGVPVEDALRGLLEGNGYIIEKRRNIFSVSGGEKQGDNKVRVRNRYRIDSFFLDIKDGKLSIDVQAGDLDQVLQSIADRSRIQLISYGTIKGTVNAQFEDVPITEALALLLKGTQYTFVQQGNIILVGEQNSHSPSGKVLLETELVKLKHIKAESVPSIVPKSLGSANLNVIREQNAILVAGTSEDIVNIKNFLRKIDIPTPQVVIDVIVVEYSMDVSKDFGFECGLDSRKGNQNSYPLINYSRSGENAKKLITDIFGEKASKYLGYLGKDFYLQLRLMVQQNKARVLAQPTVTVLNGHKASINVGQTQYYRVVGGTSENPTYTFRPIKFGIVLNITPWITPEGQITADITPDISNSTGLNEDGYPNVFSRSISTTVRLDNEQTLALGGLIRRNQHEEIKKVPILGDIPILGYLFRTTKKFEVETNLVIYITPRIVRSGDRVNIDSTLKNLGFKTQGKLFKRPLRQEDINSILSTGKKRPSPLKDYSNENTESADTNFNRNHIPSGTDLKPMHNIDVETEIEPEGSSRVENGENSKMIKKKASPPYQDITSDPAINRDDDY